MRSKKQLTACMLLTALLANTALAADTNEPNVFNADTSHPDLAAAISAFEQVCMPFVLHRTELTQKQNVQHRDKLMESLGFTYQSSELQSRKVVIEAARSYWRPSSVAVNPTGEINENSVTKIPAKIKVVAQKYFKYKSRPDHRVTANMVWNYASQKHPGKSCDITFATNEVSLDKFTADFIVKDADWVTDVIQQPTQPGSWSQCVEDGEDDFEFKVSHEDDTIKFSMKRSDFYEPVLCGKTPH